MGRGFSRPDLSISRSWYVSNSGRLASLSANRSVKAGGLPVVDLHTDRVFAVGPKIDFGAADRLVRLGIDGGAGPFDRLQIALPAECPRRQPRIGRILQYDAIDDNGRRGLYRDVEQVATEITCGQNVGCILLQPVSRPAAGWPDADSRRLAAPSGPPDRPLDHRSY